MTRRLAVVAAAAFALTVPTASMRGQALVPAVPSTTSATAADALAAWATTFNTRDPKRIVALYAPDAVFWGTTARTLARTPEDVWAYFKDAGQRPDTRVRIDSQVARAYGGIAVVSGAYTFFDLAGGAETNVRPARFTFVFRRVDGRWLIVDHHSSRVPLAP